MGETTLSIFGDLSADVPTQQKFLKSPAKYRLFSSGYGSGKTTVGCRESIRHALQWANGRHLVGRLTAADLRESTMTTFFDSCDRIGLRAGDHYDFLKSEQKIRWANGSETLFRHLDDPTGSRFGSLELNTAFIDEGSEVSDAVYRIIVTARVGRWRGSKCPNRAWVCTNPGPSGYLLQVVHGRMPDWEWFAALPGENKHHADPEYNARLAAMREVYGEYWYQRYVAGSWDAFEGQRFTNFNREQHVLPTDFYPAKHHGIIEGWDFGWRETFVSWIAVDDHDEDPPVVFAELQANERDVDWISREVKRIRSHFKLDAGRIHSFGDPAGRQRGQVSGVSAIQAYADRGIWIAPQDAGKDPQARADLLGAFLSKRRHGYDGRSIPGIVFSPRCRATIDSVVNLRWKDNTNSLGEQGKEQFLKVNDHGFDALTYGLVGVPAPDIPRAKPKLTPGAMPNAKMISSLASDDPWVEAY